MFSSINLIAIGALLGAARAWHLQVHNQIAFTAEELLTDRTLNVTASLLDPKYKGSIGRAAAWADTVRKDKNGATFSYGWHFVGLPESINATHPPSTCSNNWTDVCSDSNCVVAQIANQTSILRGCVESIANETYVDDVNCQQALMWVVHFVGDVGQPLHSSGTYYGGNIVPVLFNGTKTNLHNAWDQQILYYGASHPFDFSDTHLDDYFDILLTRIVLDDFDVPRDDWVNCSLETVGKDDSCAKRWAEDSHALVCNAVYTEPLSSTSDLLENGYAKRVFPYIELQLAKAAWRLSEWLNSLVDEVFDEANNMSADTGLALEGSRTGEQQPILG